LLRTSHGIERFGEVYEGKIYITMLFTALALQQMSHEYHINCAATTSESTL